MTGHAEFRVFWIPQVPMKAFRYDVPSLDAGKMLCDALARYDLFQFENRVKPDYANAGGIEWKHPRHTDGEWESVDPDDEWKMGEVARMLVEDANIRDSADAPAAREAVQQ